MEIASHRILWDAIDRPYPALKALLDAMRWKPVNGRWLQFYTYTYALDSMLFLPTDVSEMQPGKNQRCYLTFGKAMALRKTSPTYPCYTIPIQRITWMICDKKIIYKMRSRLTHVKLMLFQGIILVAQISHEIQWFAMAPRTYPHDAVRSHIFSLPWVLVFKVYPSERHNALEFTGISRTANDQYCVRFVCNHSYEF